MLGAAAVIVGVDDGSLFIGDIGLQADVELRKVVLSSVCCVEQRSCVEQRRVALSWSIELVVVDTLCLLDKPPKVRPSFRPLRWETSRSWRAPKCSLPDSLSGVRTTP